MVYEVYLPTELIDPILDSVWHVPTNPNLVLNTRNPLPWRCRAKHNTLAPR